MDPAEALEMALIERQKPIAEAIASGDSDIQKFYRGTTVLVTGGSGFLGKLLIEKLLRSCEMTKIYIILRPKNEKTVQQRLTEILKDPVFDVLSKQKINFLDKVHGVEGDITQLGLGISEENWKNITNEVHAIFHLAATIKFNEPLKEAVRINIFGTNEIIKLATACEKLRAMVHVSTAYSHATKSKSGGDVLEEFYPSPMSPQAIMELVDSMDESKLKEITPLLIKDWPNTYVFTKAITEELVRLRTGDLPTCIVRPSVVMCSYKEPSPGWIDKSSVFGPSGILMASTFGVMHVIPAKSNIKIDLTPVDYVVNATITAGWETGTTKREGNNDIKIYTVTNARNGISCGEFLKIMDNKARSVFSPKAMWYAFVFNITNDLIALTAMIFLHFIPGLIVHTFMRLTGKKSRLMKIYTGIYKYSKVFKYFLTNDWKFSDKNLKDLEMKMSRVDRIIYNFQVENIDWVQMILIWVIGLRKYIVKDGLKDTALGVKRQRIFKLITFIIAFLFTCVIFTVFYGICVFSYNIFM